MRSRRVIDAFLGLGALLTIGAFLLGVVLVYDKAFTSTTSVTLSTSAMGNALQKGSDVKYHGVPVGEVADVEPGPGGARLTLHLDPDVAETLPATTTALLLPKTLFGERYVDLVAPEGIASVGSATLADGATIRQDSSDRAVQLQDVFDHLLPTLQALQPQKLQATLGELAAMLRGEGNAIGDNLASWAAYLTKLNPEVPQMADDLAALGDVADTYADAVPDLLDALDSMTTTSKTLVAESTSLSSVFANVIAASDTTTGWVEDNQQTITVLSAQSRKALRAVAPYADEFPCLLDATANFVPRMDATLGKGSGEPGVHVVLNVEPSRGKYRAGTDKPTSVDGGARCPYQTGKVGTSSVGRATDSEPPSIPAPPLSTSTLLGAADRAAAGLGEANSPAENQLIAELVAPSVGLSPSDYPTWGSLLLGPVLRGAEVTLR